RESRIRRVQLALDPLRESPSTWSNVGEILQQANIEIVSGMFGCIGEDYSTLDSIRITGGVAPDTTWEHNLVNIRETVSLAVALGLNLVTFHAGFVPHDPTAPAFHKMLERLSIISDIFAAENINVGLETGQETAAELAVLLESLDCTNLVVNFDPANMILYGKGDPIQALNLLAPWIQQVHIKDALPSSVQGEWGEEVVVGEGDVDWSAFFATLNKINFAGDLVIEREAGNQRLADIDLARHVILNCDNHHKI
ncbi:MAG: sugar phosphate isomerase/epimerase, partial [Akkermansiaceae bacterium]|nr:sugar phosphate isomerase/epimerase [Akkermansiaceae bacterium]